MAAAEQHHSVLYWVLSLVVAPLLVGLLLLTTAPWWWPRGGDAPAARGTSVVGFAGGCGAFRLYAQDRWEPYGASVRAAPAVLARKVGDLGPNEIVAVDGWVHAGAGYLDNPPPFDNDVWFHLADNSGWVAFAAVRALSTSPASTNRDNDGGPAAATPPQCEGAIR